MAFLSPLFLLGLAAAALPVLVHLVRRTRARRIRFASLMFLRSIEQKTIRKRHLRNLLLLALRCAALGLLALAFSRPYLTGASQTPPASDQPSSVILLDGSYSMQYPGAFDRAKREALRILEDAAPNERVAVVVFASSTTLLRPLKPDLAEARAVIEQAAPGHAATDYVQAIQTANALLRDVAGARRRVYLISDFHESGWNRLAPPVRLAAGVELIPVDVSDPSARNLAVLDVRAEQVVYAQKYAGKVAARVGNFTSEPNPDDSEQTSAVVELKLNDLVVERREVKLASGSSETVEFTGFNVLDGSNRATVEISGDRFLLDNKYYFTIERQRQLKVLAIETATRGRSESFFLQQSLLAGDTNPYALTVKTAGSADPSEIGSYRAVVLNDAAGINEALAGALVSFVERGGGLVLAAGRHADAPEFNRKFKAISPAELGEAVLNRGAYSLMSQVKTDHPIFGPFARSGRLTSTRVYGYRRSTPREGAAVIAALDDGSPLIVEGLAGRGRVLLITTTLDTAWNDLPITPIFLPLLNQMLDYLTGRESGGTHTLGQAFSVTADDDGSEPAVDSPGGKRMEPVTARSFIATEPGFYRLRYRDRTEYVGVNLDTRDSDLSKLKIDELLASVAAADRSASQQSADQERLTPEEVEKRQRLWLPLLVAALVVFLAEAVLARRIKVPKLIG